MMMLDPAAAILRTVARELGPLAEQVTFVGGAVLPLLHDRPSGMRPRPTDDVDALVATVTAADWVRCDEALHDLGFQPMREAKHVHRWTTPSGLVLDLVPSGAHLGGTGSPWDAFAIETATVHVVDGIAVRVASAIAIVLLKWQAWQDRGGDDWVASHDLEDLVGLLAMRGSLVREATMASPAVRAALREIARTLHRLDDLLDDVLAAHLNGADDPRIARSRATAALAGLGLLDAT